MPVLWISVQLWMHSFALSGPSLDTVHSNHLAKADAPESCDVVLKDLYLFFFVFSSSGIKNFLQCILKRYLSI